MMFGIKTKNYPTLISKNGKYKKNYLKMILENVILVIVVYKTTTTSLSRMMVYCLSFMIIVYPDILS